MSMINDALRRASGTNAPSAPPPLPLNAQAPEPPPIYPEMPAQDEGVPPMMRRPSGMGSLPILLLALFFFCLAAAAGVFLWERSHHAPLPKQNQNGQTLANGSTASQPTKVQAKTADSEVRYASVPPLQKPTAPTNSTTSTAKPASAPTNAVAAAAPAPANVTFPKLRLQSIYYRPPDPSVMINGHTLYVNDEVQGVTVAAIDRASVTLVLSGRTNVLTLR